MTRVDGPTVREGFHRRRQRVLKEAKESATGAKEAMLAEQARRREKIGRAHV